MLRKDYNWVVGCLALVLTLTVLFGGQLLWNKYAVANPINKMLQNINGVESVTIGRLNEQGKNNEKVKVLYIKLKNVSNLQVVYGEIIDGLKHVDAGNKFDIVIQDTRTPELEQFYYNIHYYVQEAIFTGNFATMADRINAKASGAGVDAQIYVDTQNIYLKMTKGNAEMYVVVSRNGSSLGVK